MGGIAGLQNHGHHTGAHIGAAVLTVMVNGDDVGAGIAMIAFGLVFMVWGKYISNNKKFKKWWKQVETNNLEPQIAASAEVAIEIYKKNPQKRTLKKIAALNPSAAEMIETLKKQRALK